MFAGHFAHPPALSVAFEQVFSMLLYTYGDSGNPSGRLAREVILMIKTICSFKVVRRRGVVRVMQTWQQVGQAWVLLHERIV